MCLLCIEISKRAVTPKDFWRNLKEISEDHFDDVIKVVSSMDEEYKEELAKEALS